uniref:Uncharacterized protein n=1 Tax=Anguilla anguilla TaxID=7936 RepID=A0A0E9QBR5_ANGAN
MLFFQDSAGEICALKVSITVTNIACIHKFRLQQMKTYFEDLK